MIQLREASIADYAAIAQLHATSWQENYRYILTDHYLDNEVAAERLSVWKARLEPIPKNQYTTLAVQHEKVIGFCCLLVDEDPLFGSLIDNLHVTSSLQQSGIGKMMISHAAKTVCEHATNNKLYLWVFEANTRARAAYERLGATNVEAVIHHMPDGSSARTCRYTWNDASIFL